MDPELSDCRACTPFEPYIILIRPLGWGGVALRGGSTASIVPGPQCQTGWGVVQMWLELRLLFFDVAVAGVVTVLAFHGVGCVHLSSLAVTVLMTSGSSFCLSQRLLHYSFLALTALRTEVVLEFFAKVDDNPNWFPGKHTSTKRGLARLEGMLCWKGTRNGQGLQILRGNPYRSDSDR